MARVAVGQMCAGADWRANLAAAGRLAAQARAAGCGLLCLPEACAFLGGGAGAGQRFASALDGPVMAEYRALARREGLWLSVGGFQERPPEAAAAAAGAAGGAGRGGDGRPDGTAGDGGGGGGAPGKIFNTHVVLDAQGQTQGVYRKIHLFDVDVPGGPVLRETGYTLPGGELSCVDTPFGRLGLTTCYDLRFPEMYQILRFDLGAEVLLVPSAFTVPTGAAHWEPLLRARAIETQCYVLAAAQAGRHSEGRESYGHALAVDPWGRVAARRADPCDEGIAVAEVDLDALAGIRRRMPVAQHRERGRAVLERFRGPGGAEATSL